MNQSAIIIGATGLVGKNLLHQILEDSRFDVVKVFARRSTGIANPKLIETITDFDHLDIIQEKITGNVLFSCLGTTLKKAGSKADQYKIDYDYQYQFAQLAKQNKVDTHVLISSSGASSKSMVFYSRMKGELEEAIIKLNFDRQIIVQPSVLEGEREENRVGEKWGAKLINILGKVFNGLKKYRSIKGSEVAKAMLKFYFEAPQKGLKTYALDELFV